MKQGTIIAAGVVLIIIVSLVWVYLLFFGTPEESTDIFANLGFSEETLPRENLPILPSEEELETHVDTQSTALTQLTTRAVAGFGFVENASTTLRYAERGIGYIYEIDVLSGNEKRVLGKTFTGITEAVFSPGRNAVVLIAHNPSGSSAFLELIDNGGELNEHSLPIDIENIKFLSDTDLRYTIVNTNGMSGFSYNLSSMETSELFTIPFTDGHVIWGDDRIFVYNRPAPFHKGGLYEINGGLHRIGETEYGLSAMSAPLAEEYVLTYANIKHNVLVSSLITETQDNEFLPTTALPEKCVFNPVIVSELWCGAPIEVSPRTYQTDWYKGLLTSNDYLWSVNIEEGSASAQVNFQQQTGRVIDVHGIQIDSTGTYLLFKNKLDNTLWFYNTQFGVIEQEITEAEDEI